MARVLAISLGLVPFDAEVSSDQNVLGRKSVSRDGYQRGCRAEDFVCDRLESLGWQIEERNFRGKTGELDLIAREGETWVFCEIKAAARRPPVEALQPMQMARIRRAAQEYLQKRVRSLEVDMRFDVCRVWGEPFQWDHVRDAF